MDILMSCQFVPNWLVLKLLNLYFIAFNLVVTGMISDFIQEIIRNLFVRVTKPVQIIPDTGKNIFDNHRHIDITNIINTEFVGFQAKANNVFIVDTKFFPHKLFDVRINTVNSHLKHTIKILSGNT